PPGPPADLDGAVRAGHVVHRDPPLGVGVAVQLLQLLLGQFGAAVRPDPAHQEIQSSGRRGGRVPLRQPTISRVRRVGKAWRARTVATPARAATAVAADVPVSSSSRSSAPRSSDSRTNVLLDNAMSTGHPPATISGARATSS